ncbi:Copper transporter (plasmid) [Cupriavidus sp. H19C3]
MFRRETVESLAYLVKRPLQLLALCMVLYLASQSFPVGVFVTIVGISYLYNKAVLTSRSVPAAPKVSMPDSPSRPKADAPQAEEQPEQRYERSAVVTPLRRTGTDNRS